MHVRLKEKRGIHLRDPLFVALFQHADQIELTFEETEKGLKVREVSEDPYVAKLIQAHARVVSKFIENGPEEVRKNHEVPPRDKPPSSDKLP